MNKDAIYTDAPTSLAESLTAGEIMPDFLPPPEQLVRRMSKATTTIKRSLAPHRRQAPSEKSV